VPDLAALAGGKRGEGLDRHMTERTMSKRITVTGVVQGVGFRPFVYRLAHDHGLAGWVLNHSGGVDIHVEGQPAVVAAFLHDLGAKAPPLARIEQVTAQEVPPNGYTTFEIRHSVAQEGRYQLISPDIATCPACLQELLDPNDRRYRYPFTNCTNCGPRFTIIADVPYDRPKTTMCVFPMCSDCQAEYEDPLDRRFHAQPNACPACGPHVWLEPSLPSTFQPSDLSSAADEIQAAARLLGDGAILAIKGLGGFHLACDATNAGAVARLRERKRRPSKPMAVMMATLEDVHRHCQVNDEEEELLTSWQCPIVLLRWKTESSVVRGAAPGNNYLGVMLPYTPLHHVLLRDVGRPLVMTSGNLSEEPIAEDNDEARRRLGRLCDYFLFHNRDIYARYDDSVWMVADLPVASGQEESSFLQTYEPAGLPQPLRRSRGYAPYPVKLPFEMRQVLAVGAELKNTFCFTKENYAFLSQHVGDMENLETLEHFEASVALYRQLFRLEPEIVAHDLHPDYLATKYASRLAPRASRIPVQHHHAHVGSCLADNRWPPEAGPVIGVAWDGTGLGDDGRIWGGEFLVADYTRYDRAAHLEYLPLPGGDAATRNPYRIALAYLYKLLDIPPADFRFTNLPVDEAALAVLQQQIDRGINTPFTSSAGRLFDAVSALLGVCTRATYEAQAAIELEMVADGELEDWKVGRLEGWNAGKLAYPFEMESTEGGLVIRLRELLDALMDDLRRGMPVPRMSARFHATMAQVIVGTCQRLAAETGLRTVALSGGVFQNRRLLAASVAGLQEIGFRVLTHRQVPTNDGGLSLGQAVIANFAAQAS
jgi:hydrogenase maturation protein HypF